MLPANHGQRVYLELLSIEAEPVKEFKVLKKPFLCERMKSSCKAFLLIFTSTSKTVPQQYSCSSASIRGCKYRYGTVSSENLQMQCQQMLILLQFVIQPESAERVAFRMAQLASSVP